MPRGAQVRRTKGHIISAASSAKIRRDLGSKLVYLAAHVIMETMITLSQQILDVLHQEFLIFPSPYATIPWVSLERMKGRGFGLAGRH